MCFIEFLALLSNVSHQWLYFDLPHGHLCYAMLVEQRMSKNSVPAQTTVGPWCTPRTVVHLPDRGEPVTAASLFSGGYVA